MILDMIANFLDDDFRRDFKEGPFWFPLKFMLGILIFCALSSGYSQVKYRMECRRIDSMIDQGYALVSIYGKPVTENLCADEIFDWYGTLKVDDENHKIIIPYY